MFSRGVGRDWETRIRTTELTTEDCRGERAGTCVFRWWVTQVTVTLHSTRTPLREQAPPAPPPRSLSRSIECASRAHNRNTSARRMWNYHSEDEMGERNGQSRRACRNNDVSSAGCSGTSRVSRCYPEDSARQHRRHARYRGPSVAHGHHARRGTSASLQGCTRSIVLLLLRLEYDLCNDNSAECPDYSGYHATKIEIGNLQPL